ncbi:MAG: PHP domain-containing protein [Planctomycetota bacterium]|jgi:predicted metal-dependent phosphoesterase TrpH
MKVELHLHTSRYSSCSVATPDELMDRLVALGYEAVYLTEHDALWPADELARLQAEHPRIRIFPGVELTITQDPFQHLLVLGTTDEEYLRMVDPAGVLDRARAAGHLTILAHPFRFNAGAALVAERHLLPDALEYCSCNQPPVLGRYVAELAAAHGLALVNAGDCHALDFLGRYWIETDRELIDPGDIREVVLSGAYVNRRAGGGL